jgi:hypothetical protein
MRRFPCASAHERRHGAGQVRFLAIEPGAQHGAKKHGKAMGAFGNFGTFTGKSPAVHLLHMSS